MGRVAVATVDVEAGGVVLVDVAAAWATVGEGRCLACGREDEGGEAHACAEPGLRARVPRGADADGVVEEVAGVDGVGETDRARAWLRALATGADAAPPFASLCAEGVDRCREAARAVFAHPGGADWALPGGRRDAEALERAAMALARLNANSHDLTDRAGSGLFPRAAMLEHSCRPNCNATTKGALLWVNATRDVRAGERLSIDYLSADVLSPVPRRRAALLASHGFLCACEGCSHAPDPARSFRCAGCGHASALRPAGAGAAASWACGECGRRADAAERAALEAAEAAAGGEAEVPVERLLEVFEGGGGAREAHEALGGPPLALSHHLLFWQLHDFSRLMLDEGRHTAAERSWEALLDAARGVVPPLTDEWLHFLEHLAQVRVAAGRPEDAAAAWREALAVAEVVHGPDTPPTLSVRALSERPPRSVAEMEARYEEAAADQQQQ